jgi:probable addiction module antidote protein
MERTAEMSKLKGAVSHHEAEVAELRADRELAVEYLKAAMESLDDPNDRAAGLLALRTVAEAYGGLAAVAAEAGISRESLYRTLSPKGNPTLKTLLAVLKTVGLRLSVESEERVEA